MSHNPNVTADLMLRGSSLAVHPTGRLLTLPAVVYLTGKSKSSIYADIKMGAFPSPVKIGVRRVAWRTSDLASWLDSRAPARVAA